MAINDLQRKLGVKPNQKEYILYAPVKYENYLPSPTLVHNTEQLPNEIDWLQAFYLNKSDLERDIGKLMNCMSRNGQLWISWPKKTSKVSSDLSDGVVREIGLNAGLVDVKVAAINEVWSGLKFVYRIRDRKTKVL